VTTLELLLSLLMTMMMTALFTWPLRVWLLARGLVDHPGARRSHELPTPRGGGLAVALAMLVALILFGGLVAETFVVVAVVIATSALGWLDDTRGLAVRWRLLAQIVIGLLLIIWLGPVTAVSIGPFSLDWPLFWTFMALVAFVWLMNLHNFMDGSDGLLAMQGSWTGLAMGVLLHIHGVGLSGLVGFVMAGACLGFMFWNKPPARIFMGDSGSILLGGVIGLLALSGAANGDVSIWVSLIICSVFVVDATATLVQRALKGREWYTPHREHAYQRLISRGWGHDQALVMYGLINLVIVLPVLLLAVRFPGFETLFALGLVGFLFVGWWSVQARQA